MALFDVFTEVSANSLLAGVDCQFGKRFLSEQGAPPRAVWVPSQDRFEGPIQAKTVSGSKATRALHTREAGCDIHLWAVDEATLETLINNFVAALHQAAHGSYDLTGGAWGDDQFASEGAVYTLSISVLIPITAAPTGEVTVTSETITSLYGS